MTDGSNIPWLLYRSTNKVHQSGTIHEEQHDREDKQDWESIYRRELRQ